MRKPLRTRDIEVTRHTSTPRQAPGRFLLPFLLSLTFTASCSTSDSANDQAGGGEGNSASAGIFGTWEGNFSQKVEDDDLNLKQADVTLKFAKSDHASKDPTFSMTIEAHEIEVKGTFAKFNDESLLLAIEASNLSTVGSPGSLTEVQYLLQGKMLKISNERFSTLSQRKSDRPADTGNPSGNDNPGPDQGFVGSWDCGKDSGGNEWELAIQSDARFRVDMSQKGHRGLELTGTFQSEVAGKSGKGVLNIEQSNNANYKGRKLHFSLSDGKGELAHSLVGLETTLHCTKKS